MNDDSGKSTFQLWQKIRLKQKRKSHLVDFPSEWLEFKKKDDFFEGFTPVRVGVIEDNQTWRL